MFVEVHPDFDQKSEGSKYQNSMTQVTMINEKYQWNVMVAGELNNPDDSSFSGNLFSLVETHTMDMDFQLELQTSIRDVTAKLKIKATLHILGGRFKVICTKWKVMGKTDKQVL